MRFTKGVSMGVGAFICGLSGARITSDERAFLAESRPWGVILFTRNVVDADQLRRLAGDLRALLGEELPILVDQEGGRVQRIGPPLAPPYPPARAFGELYAVDPAKAVEAARLGASLIGSDLRGLGIDVDCLPLLDMPAAGADPIIGDRAFSSDPQAVIELGRAQIDGLLASGVLPVMKHLPGHGRAPTDSHKALPVVDAGREEMDHSDFVPFRALAGEVPLAMTAHVLFARLDQHHPATWSRDIIESVIRRSMGFQGALMSDDLAMAALEGSPGERARRALDAGCDLALYCEPDLTAMQEVATQAGELSGAALTRCGTALAWPRSAPMRRPDDGLARLHSLLKLSRAA